MKNNILKSAIMIAVVLTFGMGISAYQIDSDTELLSTSSGGNSTIRGSLYTTSSNPDYTHMADTTTTVAIGDGLTIKIMARVVGSPAVYETRTGYKEVDAYGNTASSTHEAWSDIDHIIIDVPPFE